MSNNDEVAEQVLARMGYRTFQTKCQNCAYYEERVNPMVDRSWDVICTAAEPALTLSVVAQGCCNEWVEKA